MATALGTVQQGDGNNGTDGTEGCTIKNVFGTYSHGPVLVKNPAFADELLRLAIARKYGSSELQKLQDDDEMRAHAVAKSRPR
jgi:CobQ-like glutamine amidotransferase family enzyme